MNEIWTNIDRQFQRIREEMRRLQIIAEKRQALLESPEPERKLL